jgi:tetratricopeptide (TPR) repeat protein
VAAPAESPVDLMRRALEAYFDEEYSAAVPLFERLLSLDKKNPRVLAALDTSRKQIKARREETLRRENGALRLARAALARRDPVEAYERVRGILLRVPDHPGAKSWVRSFRKKTEKSLAKAKTGSADALFAQGLLAYMDEDWFKAVNAWQDVVAFDPDRVRLVDKIALARQHQKEKEIRDAVASIHQTAWAHFRQQEYDHAAAAWRELLRVDLKNAEAQDGVRKAAELGRVQRKLNRYGSAQALSSRAMDAYIDQSYTESSRLWRQVMVVDPGNALATEYLGRLRERGVKSAAAVPPPSIGVAKARAFFKDGQYAEAAEALERTLENKPDDVLAENVLDEVRAQQKALAGAAYNEGLTAYADGFPQVAVKKLNDALRVDPAFIRARQAIAKIIAEGQKRERESAPEKAR